MMEIFVIFDCEIVWDESSFGGFYVLFFFKLKIVFCYFFLYCFCCYLRVCIKYMCEMCEIIEEKKIWFEVLFFLYNLFVENVDGIIDDISL